MASILILLANGRGVQLANRLKYEKHIVKTWGNYKWEGQVSNYLKLAEQYDLVLVDGPGLGQAAEELVAMDKLVIGGGLFHDKIGLDADYKSQVIEVLFSDIQTDLHEGIPLSIQGFFVNGKFISPVCYTLRYERLMDGDKGPMTGMGDVVWTTPKYDKITSLTLARCTELLTKVNYFGPFTVETYVSEQTLRIKDIVAGFTWDTFQAWMELVRTSTFEFLYTLKEKEMIDAFNDQYAIAVRLIIDIEGEYQLTVIPEAMKHAWIGNGNVMGCVTARSNDLRECRRRAYRTINNHVNSPEIMYRSDIGKNAEVEINRLREWGWL